MDSLWYYQIIFYTYATPSIRSSAPQRYFSPFHELNSLYLTLNPELPYVKLSQKNCIRKGASGTGYSNRATGTQNGTTGKKQMSRVFMVTKEIRQQKWMTKLKLICDTGKITQCAIFKVEGNHGELRNVSRRHQVLIPTITSHGERR